MRARPVAIVAAVASAAAAGVVALAASSADGLPSYTDGYQAWPRLNARPFRGSGPLSNAHAGLKNVYASKRKSASKYPNGTVIVKTVVRTGTGYVGQVAVMRKVAGRWGFVEYERSGPRARYTVLAKGRLCQSCHAQARSSDYVFTR